MDSVEGRALAGSKFDKRKREILLLASGLGCVCYGPMRFEHVWGKPFLRSSAVERLTVNQEALVRYTLVRFQPKEPNLVAGKTVDAWKPRT